MIFGILKTISVLSFMFTSFNSSFTNYDNHTNTTNDDNISLTAGVVDREANIINCNYYYNGDNDYPTQSISNEYFDYENYECRTSNTNTISLINDASNALIKENKIETISIDDKISLTSTLVDNRVEITNTSDYPYCTFGYNRAEYDINNPNYSIVSRSSSSLVGPNLLLTAAHCVYADETDDGLYNPAFCNKFTAYFVGKYISNSKSENCYKYHAQATSIHIPIEYYESEDSNYDWAIVELDTALGNILGYNTLLPNWYENGHSITSYGYPSDKCHNDNNYTQLWKTSGKLTGSTTYEYQTDAYSFKGQSGSPLLANINSKEYVVGILTRGNDSVTSFVRITDLIYNYINSYFESKGPYLCLDIVNKESKIWFIRVSNYSSSYITFYYNSKMCYLNDAKTWSNLSDINSLSLGTKTSLVVQIKENWFATAIAVSYINGNTRYITSANNLNTNGTLSYYYNSMEV